MKFKLTSKMLKLILKREFLLKEEISQKLKVLFKNIKARE